MTHFLDLTCEAPDGRTYTTFWAFSNETRPAEALAEWQAAGQVPLRPEVLPPGGVPPPAWLWVEARITHWHIGPATLACPKCNTTVTLGSATMTDGSSYGRPVGRCAGCGNFVRRSTYTDADETRVSIEAFSITPWGIDYVWASCKEVSE